MTMELPQDTFAWLKKECARAKKAGDKANHKLIGHIKEEYKLEWDKNFEDFILGDCLDHPQMQSHTKGITVLNTSKPFYIESLWVNYQKKYDFNPLHIHSGVFSFVIWIEVPYDMKEEMKQYDKCNGQETATFFFQYNGPLGSLEARHLVVDKSYEWKCAFFPARMYHGVNPFYTSDGTRVSVSGNLFLIDI